MAAEFPRQRLGQSVERAFRRDIGDIVFDHAVQCHRAEIDDLSVFLGDHARRNRLSEGETGCRLTRICSSYSAIENHMNRQLMTAALLIRTSKPPTPSAMPRTTSCAADKARLHGR
jgi:hypothetical protein